MRPLFSSQFILSQFKPHTGTPCSWITGSQEEESDWLSWVKYQQLIQSNFSQVDIRCCCSVTQWCPTPCDPMDWSKPGFPVLYHLPDLAQTHVHWVGDTIHPCHPLLPPSLPALNLSQHQGLFQWVGCLQQVAKYWSLSFSFSISPSNEYSGLIFFRIDWFDLLAVQGALKSLLQHHNLFESISSSVLNLLYGPTLTLVHDYWKNHRFDYTDLCRQSGISVF